MAASYPVYQVFSYYRNGNLLIRSFVKSFPFADFQEVHVFIDNTYDSHPKDELYELYDDLERHFKGNLVHLGRSTENWKEENKKSYFCHNN